MRRKLSVDVIIPTYKPEKEFAKLLDLLSVQSYPIEHIMIMNTGEENWDRSFEEGRSNLEVYHIKKEQFDHGGTRDAAAQMSMADILVFMTHDAVPKDATLIEHLVEAFQNEEVKAAYARQLPRNDCDMIERYTRAFNYPAQGRIKSSDDLDTLGIKTFFCSNVCAAYDRNTYMEEGGFEKHTIFNEDMIYAGRLIKHGYKIAYVACAEVIHSHNLGSIQQFHRNFDLAVSQAQHPEVFEGVKSIGEGMKLVKNTARYLCKQGKWYRVIQLFTRSGFKFMGYALGKRYEKLPRWMVIKFSMNKSFWGFTNES